MHDLQNRLIAKIHDEPIVDYFFLRKSLSELVDTLEGLEFKKVGTSRDIPFDAAVKGYFGAEDNTGAKWIIKPITNKDDALYHRCAEIVYLLDFAMHTLSAPTVVLTIDGKRYRGSKVVPNAINISSYDYIQDPFSKVIVADLINRWLSFDEDRNPNNYMVIQNSKSYPIVVAIDFDKSDLDSEEMKIVGTEDKFGWIRHEKNRYLTLYKAEHFDQLSIESFEDRLQSAMALDLVQFQSICERLFEGFCDEPKIKATRIINNISKRRDYINTYFRTWFKIADPSVRAKETEEYSGFGKTFLKMYQKKE